MTIGCIEYKRTIQVPPTIRSVGNLKMKREFFWCVALLDAVEFSEHALLPPQRVPFSIDDTQLVGKWAARCICSPNH